MKVMKFGGTSVGSVNSILGVKRIVESASGPVIVVVSMLGGIIDKLINTSKMAAVGDSAYKGEFCEIVCHHVGIVKEVIPAGARQMALQRQTGELLNKLKSIFQGICLIRDLSSKTLDTTVSYGEYPSSTIVAELIDEVRWFDLRTFIKTEKKYNKHTIDTDLTNQLVKETFHFIPKVSLVPGFISSDKVSGNVTNLGCGGSDHTAIIITVALDADSLEIWTDVDGFMTVDPRVISTAYTTSELSCVEAAKLCDPSVKVVYPPTIYPVYRKNIPIIIKNTFSPDGVGTVIKQKTFNPQSKAIRGTSSTNDTSLITVQGLDMVGMIGVNCRIFKTLTKNGISVLLVSQVSSENSTSIGVRNADADLACEVLDGEFAKEIGAGEISSTLAERNLATVAIVDENMKHIPGIAGKFLGTLGCSGINIIACAQGASETNISFIVDFEPLRKPLNVIHSFFFLSEYQILNLFICGVGTVGGSLVEQIRRQQQKLMIENGLKLYVIGIIDAAKAMFSREGSDLANLHEGLQKKGKDNNLQTIRDEIVGMNIFNSVFVDCMAGPGIASFYKDLLQCNVSVVAASKTAASPTCENYRELRTIARRRGAKYPSETNVGVGLSIVNTIGDLIRNGGKILKIEAVFSSTLNYISNKISVDIPFSHTIRMVQEKYHSKPDPRIDSSGKGMIRRLVILAHEAGYHIEQGDIEKNLPAPNDFFEGSLDDFWKRVPSLDADFEARRQVLEKECKHWYLVARPEDRKASVGLQEVDVNHPFCGLEGSDNIILLATERYGEYPMMIQGYGAGAGVMTTGAFVDIMSTANVRVRGIKVKRIIILGSGMVDWPVKSLGDKTFLQYARTSYMDKLARIGRSGRLIIVAEGSRPGSEVASMSVSGYNFPKVYEKRELFEAASIGVDLKPGEMVMRCNPTRVEGEILKDHSSGHISTEETDVLTQYLQEKLGDDHVCFRTGIQHHYLFVIKGGNKELDCTSPYDVSLKPFRPLMVKPLVSEAQETADLINDLILKSQELLKNHPLNLKRVLESKDLVDSVWPRNPGYRPQMSTFSEIFPQVKKEAVISAANLTSRIGYYAGLHRIAVEGVTGLYNINCENKVAAALETLKTDGPAYPHIEVSDEMGHEGDIDLEFLTIEDLDKRAADPIYEAAKDWDKPAAVAVLSDHPTPCELRARISDPIPFLIWYPGIEPDEIQTYDEILVCDGSYGVLKEDELIKESMNQKNTQ